MKKNLSALCLVLLALGFGASPAAAEESVVPSPRPADLSNSCTAKAVAVASPAGLPEWLDAAACCPRTCNVDSDCDARCGEGLGDCRFLGTCCSFCLCSLSGTSTAQKEPPASRQP